MTSQFDKFSSQLIARIDSGANIIWVYIQGDEGRAERTIQAALAKYQPAGSEEVGMAVAYWDSARGASWDADLRDPLLALTNIPKQSANTAYIMRDLHVFINAPGSIVLRRQLLQMCKNFELNPATEQSARPIIILADTPTPHATVKDYISVMDFALPDYDDLMEEAVEFNVLSMQQTSEDLKDAESDNNKENISDDLKDRICRSLLGLSSEEASNVVAFAVTENGGFNEDCLETISSEKANVIRKIDGLTYIPHDKITPIENIGGFANYKKFLHTRKHCYSRHAREIDMERPRGCVLIGAPGCLHADTPIYDPVAKTTKTVMDRWSERKAFHVWSRDANNTMVIAEAEAPWQYEPAEMFKCHFRSGRSITVTGGHKFWTGEEYVAVAAMQPRLRESGAVWLPSISESSLEEFAQGARLVSLGVFGSASAAPRCGDETDDLIKIEPAGVDNYYDFHVPVYNNYWAAGLISSNTGKTMCAKGAARILGLDLVDMDIGAMYDSFVGSSERRIRTALSMVEAMKNCVLMIDELDKALGGAHKNQATDSGVSSRILSYLLNWLSERDMSAASDSRNFVIVTLNRADGIPPELLRAGRFDRIFSTELPGATEREEILGIHLRKRGIEPGYYDGDLCAVANALDEYSGAEIEETVIAARINVYAAAMETAGKNGKLPEAEDVIPSVEDLLEAAKEITPTARMDGEALKSLREFCSGRTVPVNPPETASKRRAGRRIGTKSSKKSTSSTS